MDFSGFAGFPAWIIAFVACTTITFLLHMIGKKLSDRWDALKDKMVNGAALFGASCAALTLAYGSNLVGSVLDILDASVQEASAQAGLTLVLVIGVFVLFFLYDKMENSWTLGAFSLWMVIGSRNIDWLETALNWWIAHIIQIPWNFIMSILGRI